MTSVVDNSDINGLRVFSQVMSTTSQQRNETKKRPCRNTQVKGPWSRKAVSVGLLKYLTWNCNVLLEKGKMPFHGPIQQAQGGLNQSNHFTHIYSRLSSLPVPWTCTPLKYEGRIYLNKTNVYTFTNNLDHTTEWYGSWLKRMSNQPIASWQFAQQSTPRMDMHACTTVAVVHGKLWKALWGKLISLQIR